MTKKLFYFSIICLLSSYLTAQVGINTDNPNKSAALDIQSIDKTGRNRKGIFIPRVELRSTLDFNIVPIPEAGLLVYNTKTQNDVRANNFYYFDGTKWNPLLSKNDRSQLEQAIKDVLRQSQNLKIPLLSRIDQLTQNFKLTRDRQTIPFNTNILKRDDLITYWNGTYTVQEDGVYCITLQVGIIDYVPGADIIVGLTDNQWRWIGRATFHSSTPVTTSTTRDGTIVQDGTTRAFHVYTTFLHFKKGDVFHAAVDISPSKRTASVKGIQKGFTGNGNITNISIVKY